MNFQSMKNVTYLLLIIAFLAFVLLSYTIAEERRYNTTELNLEPLAFEGIYYTNQDFSPQVFAANTAFNAEKISTVILTGRFREEVMAGESLLFRIHNLRVVVYKNGEKIYSHAETGTFPAFVKSPGNTWDIFVSPHITPQDEVRIELSSLYYNNVFYAYDAFIRQIYQGDSGILFREMLKQSGWLFLLGAFIFLIGIVIFMACLILKLLKAPIIYPPIQFALFAMVSGMWLLLDFDSLSIIFPYRIFSNVLDVLCLSLITPMLILYLLHFIQSKVKRLLWLLEYVMLSLVICYIVLQGFGICDGYEIITFLCAVQVLAIIPVTGAMLYEVLIGKGHNAKYLIGTSIACFIMLGDTLNYFFGFFPYNICFQIGCIFFIMIHFLYVLGYIRNSIVDARRAKALEDELLQNLTSMKLSQIQPHFLYNSLTAIKLFCSVDPKRAEQAVGAFADFLRGNLDSLASRALIPFEKELTHIENYLLLEKMRFGKRLNIIYDIKVRGFLLPSLTIQPLVENAVRYGVTKKLSGGTVTISTQENKEEIVITIADDGNGFEPTKHQEDGRTHIGIENVRNRLKAQCGGNLVIQSMQGQGTVATITLPKEGNINEHYSSRR